MNLMARYNDFDTLTFMVSEFIDRIKVYEGDRKGSIHTTQKIDIYHETEQTGAGYDYNFQSRQRDSCHIYQR